METLSFLPNAFLSCIENATFFYTCRMTRRHSIDSKMTIKSKVIIGQPKAKGKGSKAGKI